jgi:hypothetical protein
MAPVGLLDAKASAAPAAAPTTDNGLPVRSATLLSFHGDPAIKAEYLSRGRMLVPYDKIYDRAIRGTWDQFSESACEPYERELGLPAWLVQLNVSLFWRTYQDDSGWLAPEGMFAAIPVGVDLTPVRAEFWNYIMQENLSAVESMEVDDGLKTLKAETLLVLEYWLGTSPCPVIDPGPGNEPSHIMPYGDPWWVRVKVGQFNDKLKREDPVLDQSEVLFRSLESSNLAKSGCRAGPSFPGHAASWSARMFGYRGKVNGKDRQIAHDAAWDRFREAFLVMLGKAGWQPIMGQPAAPSSGFS